MSDLPNLNDPRAWATAFGLAEVPLFGEDESERPEHHRVLLDGGNGTFMLSVSETPDPPTAASWAWSSDVVHHVGVMADQVILVRWDQAGPPRRFSQSSVASRIEAFYDFLLNDRVERGRGIVDHMLELFRSVRAATNHVGAPDEHSLGAFLLAVDGLAGRDRAPLAAESPVRPDDPARAFYPSLINGPLGVELERFRRTQVGARPIDLYASLAVRHAGGLIFQEAHFEILRAPALDLFGRAGRASVGPSRGGAHFTPPPIARSVVEQALSYLDGLATHAEVTVLDPACGSGAFLHEALRALRRSGFAGKIVLIGRDVSESAITMARFVLAHAIADWPGSRVKLDLLSADSLATNLPRADVVVMNPPFVATAKLTSVQREQMKRILGSAYKGRPDLSMAFVTHALAALKPGGTLGCLFPSSLLSLEGAADWRKSLADRGGLRFLATFGDFGLFEYAMVQVAAAVFTEGSTRNESLTTLWTSNDAGATGAALRHLRRTSDRNGMSTDMKAWRIGRASLSRFGLRPDWRLRSPRVETFLRELDDAIPTRVAELFEVRQGIRTGANEVFLLKTKEWEALPLAERRYFRKAITNSSIKGGRLEADEYVFYPYSKGQLVFDDEAAVMRNMQTYYEQYLLPNAALLRARKGIQTWWALTRFRSFETGGKPRVVSKYFGGIGGFAADLGGNLAVVQGQSWYPRNGLIRASAAAADRADDEVSGGFVRAYAALFNTRLFGALLDAYSTPVAGGQYDLSARYVNGINIPDLGVLYDDGARRSVVIGLERLGEKIRIEDPNWIREADEVAAEAYGVSTDGLLSA